MKATTTTAQHKKNVNRVKADRRVLETQFRKALRELVVAGRKYLRVTNTTAVIGAMMAELPTQVHGAVESLYNLGAVVPELVSLMSLVPSARTLVATPVARPAETGVNGPTGKGESTE